MIIWRLLASALGDQRQRASSRCSTPPRLIHSMYFFSPVTAFYLIGTGALKAARPASVIR